MPHHVLRELAPWIVCLLSVASGCDATAEDNVFVPLSRDATWTQDVEGIIQDACSDCHAPTDAVPLNSYASASRWSEGMLDVALGVAPHVPTGLTDAEVEALASWHESGAPRGPEPIPAADGGKP